MIDLDLHSAQFALEGLNIFLPIQNRTLQCADGLLIDAAAFGCPRLAQLLFGIGQSRAFNWITRVSKIRAAAVDAGGFGNRRRSRFRSSADRAGLGVALWLDFAAVFLLFAGAVCDIGASSVGASLTGASYRLLLYLPTIGKSLTAWQLPLGREV